jgi:hypothetical protein
MWRLTMKHFRRMNCVPIRRKYLARRTAWTIVCRCCFGWCGTVHLLLATRPHHLLAVHVLHCFGFRDERVNFCLLGCTEINACYVLSSLRGLRFMPEFESMFEWRVIEFCCLLSEEVSCSLSLTWYSDAARLHYKQVFLKQYFTFWQKLL